MSDGRRDMSGMGKGWGETPLVVGDGEGNPVGQIGGMRGQAEHTPGPWSWTYSDPACTRPIALDSRAGDVLTASEDGDGPRAYASQSDMALIAAAPDMLEALRVAGDALAKLSGAPGCHSRAILARQVVVAAIAKAEGR